MFGDAYKIPDGEEIFNLPHDPNNYLIEGLLWEEQCVLLLAKEKVGKSLLSLQMACALSCGEAFLGEYEVPEGMQVLYVQAESNIQETTERLRSMTKAVSWNPKNFYLHNTDYLALDTEAGYNKLVGQINGQGLKPRVIFIDPLYMAMIGALVDEHSARHMCMQLRRLMRLYKATIILPHHAHRDKIDHKHQRIEEGDNAIAGSFVWKAFMNHVLHLRMNKSGTRSLTCETQRSNRVVRDMEIGLVSEPLHYQILNSIDHPSYYELVYEASIASKRPMDAKELVDVSGLSISAVKKSVSYLTHVKIARMVKVNPGRRPTLYQAVPTNGRPSV